MMSVRGKIHFKKFLLISIYFNLLLSVSIFSQSDSLKSYLEISASNNPTVLQKFSEYKASLQKIPQAGALPDPNLTAGVLVQRMMVVMGYQIADIRLMQMFPWFGTLKYAKDEMSLMAKANYESFLDAGYQVFFDVKSTWYDLYRLNQDLIISHRNLDILKTIERLALVHYRTAGSGVAGGSVSSSTNIRPPGSAAASSPMGSMSSGAVNVEERSESQMAENSMGNSQGETGLPDLYRIQIEITNLENEIELIKNQQNTLAAKFNSLLNRPMQTPVAIPDTLLPDSLNLQLSIIPDSIMKNNSMLAMILCEQNSIDSREKMIKRMGYPMLGIGVDYTLLSKLGAVNFPGNGQDMIMPMVSLTVPIYRRKYKSMQTEADILKSSKAHYYDATANNLKAEYYQAVQLYQDAGRRIKLYSYQYLLAKKSLDIMIKSYSVAAASLTDILLVRQQTHDYELKKAEAVTDYNKAIAWLNRIWK